MFLLSFLFGWATVLSKNPSLIHAFDKMCQFRLIKAVVEKNLFSPTAVLSAQMNTIDRQRGPGAKR
jgi:hypothetical protein